MTDSELLTMLKIDCGITTPAFDERLAQYVEVAKTEITREGATLVDTASDSQLVAMYAAWLWRKRDTGEGMPRMLRYALNQKVFSQKMSSGA